MAEADQQAADGAGDRAAPEADDGVTDDALMLRYAAGDAAAFDRLYRRHRGAIYRFFLRQMARADAEECYQEVWLKVIDARGRFQPRGEFKAWLFTIAHHALTDRYRRQMKHGARDPEAAPDELPDPAPGPEQAAGQQDQAERLYRMLAELPLAQREALLMKEQAGLSLAEIAQITGASEEGVKSRLRYAMQKLRGALTGS
jgi:RNA polymerase sigma-70 factor, ECF subfamily